MKMPRALLMSYQQKARHEPLHRIVCDYVAAMTDNFILEQRKRFFPAKKRIGV